MLAEIKKISAGIKDRVITFRREIHKNPELSGAENKTAAFVAGVLEGAGLEVRTNVGGHGVVGVLRGGMNKGQGKVIALRADMDALPIQEVNTCGYASVVPGVMHACGHDAHTSILMGAAITLSKLKPTMKGDVVFIFQPSEETTEGGASEMIKEGALSNPVPTAIVALHCFPELEKGIIAHKSGVMTASSDRFTVVVKGKGGHASRPHQSVDAILVASMVVNALHHIVSRRMDPLHHAVISIGIIRGGSAANVIADRVELKGTVRTLDAALRKEMPTYIEDTIRGITMGAGATYELDYGFGSGSVVNDYTVDSLVKAAATDVVGPHNVILMPAPVMGSEDFSCFTEKIPGSLFRLGTSNKAKGIAASLHSSSFDIDEDSLEIGVSTMAWIAARYIEG
ncbi:MAG: amidohydrolase [Deltaproteobacteria bacterium]|nr:amidohydrolase [Deltaproteobacteria bacterium]